MESKTIYNLSRYPNRAEAAEVLKKLIESGVFEDNMVENLKEIKTCIEQERYGLDLFGASHEKTAPIFINLRIPNESDSEEYHQAYAKHMARIDSVKASYKMNPRAGSVINKNGIYTEIPDECVVTEEEVWV